MTAIHPEAGVYGEFLNISAILRKIYCITPFLSVSIFTADVSCNKLHR